MSKVVYGLHSGDGVIRYVGITANGVLKRISQHRHRARAGSHYPVSCWMRSHGVASIVGVVLESGLPDLDALNAAEVRWIEELGTHTSRGGMNCTLGGEGTPGHVTSLETREKIRAANTGQTRTEESRQRMREARVGITSGPTSPETKRKLSLALTGRTMSPEAIEKTRKALTGKKRAPFSDEWIANITKAQKARAHLHTPHTEKTRAKMSASKKGKPIRSNHSRYHVNFNISKPDCAWCAEEPDRGSIPTVPQSELDWAARMSERRKQAPSSGPHVRWHLARGIVKLGCAWCDDPVNPLSKSG